MRFYNRLLEYGYTASRLDASIRAADPLSELNEKQRKEYLSSLTPRQKAQLDMANKYYGRMKQLDHREKQLFPKTPGQTFQPKEALLRQIVER